MRFVSIIGLPITLRYYCPIIIQTTTRLILNTIATTKIKSMLILQGTEGLCGLILSLILERVRPEYPQHLLVIEAKKDEDSPKDIEVVKSFIKDAYLLSVSLSLKLRQK